MGVTIPSAAGEVLEQYEISNSLRFNDGDDPYLNRTMAAGTSRRIFTFSTWIKRSTLGSFQYVFTNSPQSSFDAVRINDDDTLDIRLKNNDFTVRTNRVYRDVSAWYHIVVAVDTTQSTDSNRVKIYTNGSLETSLAGTTYPTENYDTSFGVNGQEYQVSANTWNDDQAFDGYMTETHFIDGTAKAPTDFGRFDDNGVWIPKRYTGAYGTNGFFLEFKQTGTSANSSGIGADTSGQDNHFAVTNLAATDVTEDTCTNNFATFNPLYVDRFSNIRTLSEGNCEVDYPNSGNDGTTPLTQAVNSGKWYVEMKVVDSAGFYPSVGSINENASQTVPYGRQSTGLAIAYDTNGTLKYENSNTSYGNSVSNGDIFQIALDMDNHLLWFGINGTWQNSATQTEIENSTATNDATTKVGEQTFLTDYDDITIFVGDVNSNGTANVQLNTGNPPFSISSGNTDGKYGNFEYAVPSGYYALCTKNLAEFG